MVVEYTDRVGYWFSFRGVYFVEFILEGNVPLEIRSPRAQMVVYRPFAYKYRRYSGYSLYLRFLKENEEGLRVKLFQEFCFVTLIRATRERGPYFV